MPEIKVTSGGKAKSVKIDHIYQVRRGEEAKALDNMKKDGADNVVVKAENGDIYIASRVGVPDFIRPNDGVDIQGVKGHVIGFDNEKNTWGEVISSRGAKGAAVGGGLSVAGLAVLALKFGRALGPLPMLGIIAASGIAGFALSLLGKKKPDYDKLDPHSTREIAMAPPSGTTKPITVSA